MQIEYAELSLLGDREDNQDRVTVSAAEEAALLVVIDGMGGHSDGSRAADTALPHVTGVWTRTPDGGEALLEGDLVVDASGRRSKLRSWLPAIGTKPVREASSPCGIFYTSRFYRLHDGVEPPDLEGGIVGADLGYLKVGIFAGDSRVFSITLAASPTDADMRRVLL